ncbi:hypothetical protein GCM10011578_013490 [Streptomyces fuscichromogenes]|uniref:Uncharacterized protein n=1 Tax=Streptomyces fuscichromogenes TaxID=1324013 RepID=A0A917UHD7_9ACTN|nr:hypothetical protein GCM10011578_013490 [Streptomyces fuscichromogenes]
MHASARSLEGCARPGVALSPGTSPNATLPVVGAGESERIRAWGSFRCSFGVDPGHTPLGLRA